MAKAANNAIKKSQAPAGAKALTAESAPKQSKATIRRYADLIYALDVLLNKHLVMLDPKTWDDKNDAYFVNAYKEIKSLKGLTAICFTRSKETHHHWKVFAGGDSGVCLEFYEEKLKKYFVDSSIIMKDVNYRTFEQMKESSPLPLDDLPFTKRISYMHEDELRVLHCSQTADNKTFEVEIDLSCIKTIWINPWLIKERFEIVKQVIGNIEGASKIPIKQSRIIKSDPWQRFAKKSK